MTLYSLRQKFCCLGVLDFVSVGLLVEAIGGCLLELERAELLVYYLPDNLVGCHDGSEGQMDCNAPDSNSQNSKLKMALEAGKARKISPWQCRWKGQDLPLGICTNPLPSWICGVVGE